MAPLMIHPDERDAVVNAIAHAAALYERLPAHCVRAGEVEAIQEILTRIAPPPKHECDPDTVPVALAMARKHVAALGKVKSAGGNGHRHRAKP